MQDPPVRQLGAGQVALELDPSVAAPVDQVRDLVKLSDPALSELEFDQLLDELLVRVRDLLSVDTAAILLLDGDQLAARAAKGIEEEVEQGVRIPVGGGFAGRIAKERVAIFMPDVNHADILNPILREKGIRSMLGVPLIVDGDLIGVMHIGSLHPRTFDLRDLTILDLAAARAGPAIERGRLLKALEREHRNAVALHRNMLPRALGPIPGVDVAARYLPARDGVGGDWYDMVELPGGNVGIAIGDVVGHGLPAALLMGQLRAALRAYALEANSPARTLELLDRFANSLDEEAMATVTYAVLDAREGVVHLASAGHLPPVVVSANGEAKVRELAPGPPIGAIGYAHLTEHELPLAAGETLLLYTDGLVERPGVPLPVSIDELVETIQGARTPEYACLAAMDGMLPQRGPRDDVAVIALRVDPVEAVLELELPAQAPMLARVRQALGHWLSGHGIEREIAIEITIAANEACANAVEHAYGPQRGSFRLSAQRTDGVVQIHVRDDGHWRPQRGQDRGRGLKIVEAAMDEVRINRDEHGTEIVMTRKIAAR
ncbi:MAG: ATP-binding SpoIIE family protein phosphatase [Solirubrobacteraceae bacterium]